MDNKLDTIKKLYDWSSKGYDNKTRISVTCDVLAALCAYATSIGVQAGHNQYHKIISECRDKAHTVRYHKMASSILPDSDFLYDSRYGNAGEMRSWESDLIIEEIQ